MRDGRSWQIALLLAIIVLAAGLRLYRLDAQSLWNDEGTSVALAQRDLATITRNAADDIHPPLYYYVLHGWVRLAGASERSVRALSALIGTLVVTATYGLARRLTSPMAALLAGLVAALSPFQIYYSQEVRMYILATLLGLLVVWSGYELLSKWSENDIRLMRWPSLALIVSAIAILYTHYLGATILLGLNAAFVVWWIRHLQKDRTGPWRALLGWGAMQAIIVLAFGPWLLLTWRTLQSWPAVSDPLTLIRFAVELAVVMPLGITVEPTLTMRLAGGVLWLIAMAGLVATGITDRSPRRTDKSWPVAMIAAYLITPLLFIYLGSLQRPMYNPKFVLLATPALHILQGAGLVALARNMPFGNLRSPEAVGGVAAAILLAFVALPSGHAIHQMHTDPRYARDDYRGAIAYIRTAAAPSDGIIINAPSQIETIDYYYDGPLPMYPLARQRPPDKEETQAELAAIADQHEHLFGIFWATDESDPQGVVEGWLAEHTFKTMDRWYGNIRLAAYAVPQEQEREVGQEMDIVLGGRIRLRGYTLLTPEPRSGEILQVTLFWEALEPIEERYKVFVQLLDARNHIVGQHDSEPVGGRRPTNAWEPGVTEVDNHGLLIRPGTISGPHVLIAGLYDSEDGSRLLLSDDPTTDAIVLAHLDVRRPLSLPAVEELAIQTRHQTNWDGLELVGHSLYPIGREHQQDPVLHPGDAVELVLFWRRTTPEPPATRLVLQLTERSGRPHWDMPIEPAHGSYRWEDWQTGEIIRDIRHIVLPADITPGSIDLRIAATGDGTASYLLERLRLRAR